MSEILKHGSNSNLIAWQQSTKHAAALKYGRISECLGGSYPDFLKEDALDFTLESMKRAGLKDTLAQKMLEKGLEKKLEQNMAMIQTRPILYEFVLASISAASLNVITCDPDFQAAKSAMCPSLLWKVILKTHKTGYDQKSATLTKLSIQNEYHRIAQSQFESVAAYKIRFDFTAEEYESATGTIIPEKEKAWSYYFGLNRQKFKSFITMISNALATKSMSDDITLAGMHQLVCQATEDVTAPRSNHAAFATSSETSSRPSVSPTPSPLPSTPEAVSVEDAPDEPVICRKCKQPGHYAIGCARRKKKNIPNSKNRTHSNYSVLLDNQATISVIHPNLLQNVRDSGNRTVVAGITGDGMRVSKEGELRGFGLTCHSSEDCRTNILCFADVEDKFSITYMPNECFVVHLPDRDVKFVRKDKLYVADMKEWTTEKICTTTARERERHYTSKEVHEARKAYKFVENAGYPPLEEATRLITGGNVTGITFTKQDLQRSYDIYGPHLAAVRGRHTKLKVSSHMEEYSRVFRKEVEQSLHCDVLYIGGQAYLISVAKPLGLSLVSKIASKTATCLGTNLQDHVDMMREKGYVIHEAHVDADSSFKVLKAKIPGVNINIGGAGDHVPVADERIRRLKEIIRSAAASVPWDVPDRLIDGLVKYANSRLNMFCGRDKGVPPRVEFAGNKPRSEKEYALKFGDYVECHDPKVKSNDALSSRTEPCIALYPTGNAQGSWVFWNLKSETFVTRSVWSEMRVTDNVVSQMNSYSTKHACDTKEEVTTECMVGEDTKEEVAREEPRTSAIAEESPVPIEARQDEISARSVAQQACDDETEVPHSSLMDLQVNHISVAKGLNMYGEKARKAMREELTQMVEKKVWQYVRSSEGHKFIRSSMFLKEKFNEIGELQKIKARLVADGSQQEIQLYQSTSSPTVKTSSLMVIMKIAANEKREIRAVDIRGAYLHADMDEPVFMLLDRRLSEMLTGVDPNSTDFVRQDGCVLVKLNKALYGCKQSGKLWYDRLRKFLESIGFRVNPKDDCVFNCVREGSQVTVGFHVDDILQTGSRSNLDWLKRRIEGEFGEVQEQKDRNLKFLGMSIELIRDGNMLLSMDHMIDDVCNEVQGSVATPATSSLFDLDEEDELLQETERQLFHSTTAKLLYLAMKTRPDILLAVSFLTTRVQSPTVKDSQKLERILKYLNGTRNEKLVVVANKDLSIEAHIDASFVTHADGKGHTGVVISVGGTPVMFRSGKQKIVTKDSTEAELVALSDKMPDVIDIHEFLTYQGNKVNAPVIRQDNMSTIALVGCNSKNHRNKYLLVRQETVRDRVKRGDVKIEHLTTNEMIADALTKPIQGNLFKVLRMHLLGQLQRGRGGALDVKSNDIKLQKVKECVSATYANDGWTSPYLVFYTSDI